MKMSRFALLGLSALQLTCHQVILTAPDGSTMTLIANPGFIPANTGVSEITALMYAPTGSPVHDGTVVQCFTNLGRIDEQTKTNDGVARLNLYADSRSGQATVQCFSGGSAGTSTPPTTTPPSSLTGASLARTKDVSAVTAATGTVTVDIGSQTPASVVVTANPQRITEPRSSLITATVFDNRGNPVSNVPVIFTVDLPSDGTVLQETLDSGGSPRYTDNNGRAVDTLHTEYDPAARSKTVTVTATVPVAASLAKPVSVVIN
jgi:hypothetical protein